MRHVGWWLGCWLGLWIPYAWSAPLNMIVIVVDDLGWGDLSCFGNTSAQTPQLDALAAEGLRFAQFYVNAPICSPSRCALTTGQYPQRWKITSYLAEHALNVRRGMADWLDPAAPTLPRLLQHHGYATGHFGKWHLGGQRDVDQAPPIAHYGFAESLTNFEGMGPKLLPLTRKPGDQHEGRLWAQAEILGGPVVWMPRSAITSGYVQAALAFIRRAVRAGRPFYVNIWLDDVHSPFWPPVERWGGGTRQELYRAVLEEMDRQLAPLFHVIRTDPQLREHTLIVCCSDNGPEPNAGSSGPFRGAKGMLYEGGIRSPLMVWCPGLMPSEQRGGWNRQSVFSAMDLVPALLTLAEVKPPAGISFDGEDVSDTLLGREAASRQQPLCWRRPPDRRYVGQQGPLPDLAIREGRWKLMSNYQGEPLALFDLEQDAAETTDVQQMYPEVVSRLRAQVLAWHHSLPADRGAEWER
ncbi:MAG: N-acetylgalactosamine-6-sulfatase [Planctomycetaceae bacterium]|nr:MAG: N-acetylgalactosamine-6-sulfatase [Planctomycetaceae bacterium]